MSAGQHAALRAARQHVSWSALQQERRVDRVRLKWRSGSAAMPGLSLTSFPRKLKSTTRGPCAEVIPAPLDFTRTRNEGVLAPRVRPKGHRVRGDGATLREIPQGTRGSASHLLRLGSR